MFVDPKQHQLILGIDPRDRELDERLLAELQKNKAEVAKRTGVNDSSLGQLTEGGRKDDQDKLRYDLIPPELLESVADILTFGAKKYGPRNWEKGMTWGRPFAALMRHMWAWWRGEQTDPETGKSHLWHAACCIAFLIAFEARGTGQDDRP